jgi:hypothetical protein
MIDYSWSFLELFAKDDQLIAVRYLLAGTNDQGTVESEGRHEFIDGTVNKPLTEIVESDLVQWIEKDTTIDEVNPIKLAIEKQLKNLTKEQKVDFPWLAGTFTIG